MIESSVSILILDKKPLPRYSLFPSTGHPPLGAHRLLLLSGPEKLKENSPQLLYQQYSITKSAPSRISTYQLPPKKTNKQTNKQTNTLSFAPFLWASLEGFDPGHTKYHIWEPSCRTERQLVSHGLVTAMTI